RYWENLGVLSGHQDEASQMIARFGAGLVEINRQVEGIPAEKRKKVYFESIHKRMKTFAPESMAIFVLESAGGINVAADAVQVRKSNIAAYGKERILAKANIIDVFLAQQGRMNHVTTEMIRMNRAFRSSRRSGKIRSFSLMRSWCHVRLWVCWKESGMFLLFSIRQLMPFERSGGVSLPLDLGKEERGRKRVTNISWRPFFHIRAFMRHNNEIICLPLYYSDALCGEGAVHLCKFLS
ncbi:MAG: hypothetical protein D3903_21655, partial [Candidatus Electrothrix sp. GM3_4]|nr:hypothetical protein [Candidatus Electrothrix sp. GM3_4]